MSYERTPEQQKIIDDAGQQLARIVEGTRERLKDFPPDPFGTCTLGDQDHCTGFKPESATSMKCTCGHMFSDHRVW